MNASCTTRNSDYHTAPTVKVKPRKRLRITPILPLRRTRTEPATAKWMESAVSPARKQPQTHCTQAMCLKHCGDVMEEALPRKLSADGPPAYPPCTGRKIFNRLAARPPFSFQDSVNSPLGLVPTNMIQETCSNSTAAKYTITGDGCEPRDQLCSRGMHCSCG